MNLAAAIDETIVGDRLWFYTNYHCNLRCRYCLTSSSPASARREIGADVVLALADEAVALGFRTLGVTGGEPFVRDDMPQLLVALASRLPVVVLTNGTLFAPRLLDRLEPLRDAPIALQVSLDSAAPARNDAMRGAGTHARVVAGIERLRARGIRVRIGTTVEREDEADLRALCRLHRELGISDEDHVVRPVIRRGRAHERGLGVTARVDDVPAELTITAEGAFWGPASPTVTADGRMETAELLTRTVRPLRIPAEAMLRVATSGTVRPTGLVP